MNGNPNEWAVAYHGIGHKMEVTIQEELNGQIVNVPLTLERVAHNIITGGFKYKLGPSHQGYEFNDDLNHPGQKVGVGVYCSPSPNVMECYASTSSTEINGKKYKMGFMMRVKPDKIRYSNSQKNYWVLDGTTEQMRPYRIMVKEC